MDFSSFFSDLKVYSEEMNKPRSSSAGSTTPAGSLLNLCRQSNLGSALMRILQDKNMKPMRILGKIFEIWETVEVLDEAGNKVLNEDGSVRYRSVPHTIAHPDNYQSPNLKLDPAQTITLNNLINTINKYMEYVDNGVINTDDTGLTIRFRKEITIFWAKIISLTDKSGKSVISDGLPRLCVHKSANFSSSFIAATQARSTIMRDEGLWMSKFFASEVGTSSSITAISTDLGVNGQPGYSMNISFADGAPFEITQEDVDTCADLNTQFVDVTTFDTDYFKSLTDRIQKLINEADGASMSNNGLAQTTQPAFTTIDQSQVVNVVPDMSINNGPTPSQVMENAAVVPPVTPQPINSAMPNFNNMQPAGFQLPTNNL